VGALLTGNERLLLMDTCGETASIALSSGEMVLASEDIARGSASAEVLLAIRRLLYRQNWCLGDLDAIGVVRGPGSFTGVRAGLAAAKGLCEATGLPLAAVSRLEVLSNAASLPDGFAALDAGRGEAYVRDGSTEREWLCATADLVTSCHGRSIAVAEARLAEQLRGCATIFQPLHAADALGSVLRRLIEGGSEVGLIDANYVREEADIYHKPSNGPKHGGVVT
jgi:tRNA threonylcarbamoyladenosine biosynthesis protein TsaB